MIHTKEHERIAINKNLYYLSLCCHTTKSFNNLTLIMKEKYSKKRDEQLDILKGIGIILVVFAHVCSGYASTLVFLFHMPLFFFLSGAAMSYSKSKRYDIWKKYAE